jgi:hypothetical protein
LELINYWSQYLVAENNGHSNAWAGTGTPEKHNLQHCSTLCYLKRGIFPSTKEDYNPTKKVLIEPEEDIHPTHS